MRTAASAARSQERLRRGGPRRPGRRAVATPGRRFRRASNAVVEELLECVDGGRDGILFDEVDPASDRLLHAHARHVARAPRPRTACGTCMCMCTCMCSVQCMRCVRMHTVCIRCECSAYAVGVPGPRRPGRSQPPQSRPPCRPPCPPTATSCARAAPRAPTSPRAALASCAVASPSTRCTYIARAWCMCIACACAYALRSGGPLPRAAHASRTNVPRQCKHPWVHVSTPCTHLRPSTSAAAESASTPTTMEITPSARFDALPRPRTGTGMRS